MKDDNVYYRVTFFMDSGMNFQIDIDDMDMNDREIKWWNLPNNLVNEQLLYIDRNKIEAVTYKAIPKKDENVR